MKSVSLVVAVITLGMVGLGPAASQAQSNSEGGVGRTVKDSWITSKTKLALLTDKRVKAFEIHVETENGVVMLRGKVPSARARSAAEAVARKIDGVRVVNNQLQVVPQVHRKTVDARDAGIKKAVAERLDADARLKDASITVRSYNGTVTLSGTVPDARARARAADLVSRVPGVRAVRNELR
jgi:hyperosmotically inducible protein